jgi:hypothetical protein
LRFGFLVGHVEGLSQSFFLTTPSQRFADFGISSSSPRVHASIIYVVSTRFETAIVTFSINLNPKNSILPKLTSCYRHIMLINNPYSASASIAPPEANASSNGRLFMVTTTSAAIAGGTTPTPFNCQFGNATTSIAAARISSSTVGGTPTHLCRCRWRQARLV